MGASQLDGKAEAASLEAPDSLLKAAQKVLHVRFVTPEVKLLTETGIWW